MPYRPKSDYPSCYKDPDVTDAEHLTAAASHLIDAGYGDAAQAFISKICACFEDVPINKKLSPPARMLGRVRYLPNGILELDTGSEKYAVPAPAYDPGTDEDLAEQDRISRAKRGNDAMRHVRVGWFSQRQAAGALAGKLPNTAAFRPAVILAKIKAICDAYDPAMHPEARAVLGMKLYEIIQKNPLSADRWNNLRQNLADFGGSRYHHYGEDVTMGFAYLTKAETEIVRGMLEKDGKALQSELRGIEECVVKWTECPADIISQIHSAFDADAHNHQDLLDEIPFLKMRYDAFQKQFEPTPEDAERYYYYGTQEYHQVQRLMDANRTLQDVNNLMRCHAALCRHPDPDFHELMLTCKMIDEELDRSVPPDLYMAAANIAMARVWTVPLGAKFKIDEELAAAAEAAFPAIINRYGTAEKFDSVLLHPVPDEEKESDGDTEKS